MQETLLELLPENQGEDQPLREVKGEVPITDNLKEWRLGGPEVREQRMIKDHQVEVTHCSHWPSVLAAERSEQAEDIQGYSPMLPIPLLLSIKD